MIVMPASNTGFDCGYLFGKYPGRLGHLFSPDDKNGIPRVEFPWALDNGVYGAWSSGKKWESRKFYDFLDKYGFLNPLWVTVPDWVSDRDETLRLWDKHAPVLLNYGMNLAFVAQDGMTIDDVPKEAAIVFVGGSTEWKWKNLDLWTKNFDRVHVGKVNTYRLLWIAHESGAESCDGTGWFRGDRSQLKGLIKYLEESTNNCRYQYELWKENNSVVFPIIGGLGGE